MGLKRSAAAGAALGLVLGLWNLVSFWLDPMDDSVGGMLIVYTPMFVAWGLTGFMAARRGAGLGGAAMAGAVIGFATFAVFWAVNIVRVNLFLDWLRDWPGWQTVVARFNVSGFESFRAFTNYEYLMDAPLKLSVPTALAATLALLGGLVSMGGRSRRADC
jgi:hypothetical protein